MTAILEAQGITKQFGGLTAVNNIDFVIEQGSISSLIGPNGAGKTTFFNMITGLYMPTSGQLVFNGGIDVLKQQRQGNKLLVGLTHPPAEAELLKVPGIIGVESLPNGLLRIQHADGKAPAEALVEAAVANQWGLHQINPDQTSLEDVFVQLTYLEQAA